VGSQIKEGRSEQVDRHPLPSFFAEVITLRLPNKA
jgi:hypothetical protein